MPSYQMACIGCSMSPFAKMSREELLYDEKTYRAIVTMRRMLSNLSEQRGLEAMEALLQQMSKTSDNAEFLANLNRSLA